jgi:hypothetical protein
MSLSCVLAGMGGTINLTPNFRVPPEVVTSIAEPSQPQQRITPARQRRTATNDWRKAAVAGLIEVLSDSSAHVRAAAAQSLGRFSDLSAQRALEEATADPDPFVRDEAERSLTRLKRGIR